MECFKSIFHLVVISREINSPQVGWPHRFRDSRLTIWLGTTVLNLWLTRGCRFYFSVIRHVYHLKCENVPTISIINNNSKHFRNMMMTIIDLIIWRKSNSIYYINSVSDPWFPQCSWFDSEVSLNHFESIFRNTCVWMRYWDSGHKFLLQNTYMYLKLGCRDQR